MSLEKEMSSIKEKAGPNGPLRKRQKGAAMVSVVLLSLLLLAVCGAIIAITGMSRSSTIDAVCERQAADAAAAGMQIVLSTLRGNSTGSVVSFKHAALRYRSNKGDDWSPDARMSMWLNYTYPTAQPDRVPLTSPYDPATGLAYSVVVTAPDRPIPGVVPTPNPTWVDGEVNKPVPPVKPPKPWWHPWNCAHCSWDYTHCSLYNPPNNGTLRADGFGCRHKHCIPPANIGEATGEDGYQRLMVKVTGYGPRGAEKEIEALIKRTTFRYNPEALFYIQGSDSGSVLTMPLSGNPEVKFDSRDDIGFIVTNLADETTLDTVIAQTDRVTIVGKGDDYELIDPNERPTFFKSADEARALVAELRAEAQIRGRYFTSFPASGNAGTDNYPAFTFIDGDATVSTAGNGVLVVTGTLTFQSINTFKGLVLIVGEGRLKCMPGSNTGKIEGSVIMAKFDDTGGFLPVEIPISGGKYEFKSDRPRAFAAIETLDLQVLAVRNN
jgi:hypothetical protein